MEFNFKGGGIAINQVHERNPLLFESCGVIDSFVIFDRIESDSGEILEDRINISPLYYYGKKITRGEYVKLAIETGDYDINLLNKYHVDSVIVLETGKVVVNPTGDSMTLDEYKKSLEPAKVISFQKYKKRK